MKNDENKEIKFTSTDKSGQMGFFARVKRSIFNVEKYGEFLLEKTRVVVKYLLLLTFIFSIVLAGVSTYQFASVGNKVLSYIRNELPDFTFEKGVIKFNSYAEGYDPDLDFYDIIDSNPDISSETVKAHIDKVKGYTYGLVFLSNEVITVDDGKASEILYTQLTDMYDFEVNNKADLLNTIDSLGASTIYVTYFVAGLLIMFVTNLVTYLLDILMVCVFGYLVGRIVGIPLNFSKTFTLAVYSMTLSLLLSTIYSVVLSLTGFVIEYFNVMYLVISYIYIIAAILIIKSDLIKQQAELQKIYKVEAEVKRELEEQKEKEKEEDKKEDKKEKKKKEKEEKEEEEPSINREPDGSEI